MDQRLVKSLIESQFDLKVHRLELIGDLFCTEYLINSEIVFRFPRQKGQNEIALMPWLSSRLSFKTEAPKWIGEPTKTYPFHFVGFPRSAENPLSSQPLWSCQSLDFGRDLGLALKELHQLSVDSKFLGAKKMTRPELSFSQRLKHCEGLWRKHEGQFEEVGFPIAVLREIFMGYENLEVENEQVPIHGNLFSRQILINEKMNFVGFKDWGSVHLGDRGLDLALAWMIFEEPVAKSFFNSYGPLEESQFELSLFQALYHSVVMLPYCFKIQDENLKEWTVFSLRKSIGL